MEESAESLSPSYIYGESFRGEGEEEEVDMGLEEGYDYMCYDSQEFCPVRLFRFGIGYDYFQRRESPCQMETECFAFPEHRHPSIVSEELKDAVFTYSSPAQFPDIVNAKKSVFGSIFVKIPVRKGISNINDWKSQLDGQFSMTPMCSNAFDSVSYESSMRNSIFRAFEKLGIFKYITSSSSQWDIFPITTSALCSFRMQDGVHHTRKHSKIEERISNGTAEILNFIHYWPTGSSWTGHWDGLGMAGNGTYSFPDDVIYFGKMQDGVFHDENATLVYPNGFKALQCNYVAGKLTDYHFQFPDGLDHKKENWEYCRYPDRRFWSEVQYGLKHARVAKRTHEEVPRIIPDGCYDTNDGFYNPMTKKVVDEENEILRVPTCKEDKWIKENCRGTFRAFTGFRPDLYENWFNNDEELINALLNMRKMYDNGLITYDELYEFFGESDILPWTSSSRKTNRQSQLEIQKALKFSQKLFWSVLDYRMKKIYEGKQHSREEKLKSSVAQAKQKPLKKYVRPKSGKVVQTKKLSSKRRVSTGSRMIIDNTSQTNIPVSTKSLLKKYSRVIEPMNQYSFADYKETSFEPLYEEEPILAFAKEIILGIIHYIVKLEREKHRNRFIRTQHLNNLPFGARDKKERCVQELEKLYWSIPDKDEFCDSMPDRTCDLKKLAEDRFHTLRYWGKRIFNLNYDENQ